MIDKLEEVERRFDRLTAEMSNPTVYADSARYQKIARERSGIEKLVETYRVWKKIRDDLKTHNQASLSLDRLDELDGVHDDVLNALQFTPGNDIKAAAHFCQQPQDREIGIRLYRIANEVIAMSKRTGSSLSAISSGTSW